MWWTIGAAAAAIGTAGTVAARDGDRLEREQTITFGLVGGLADATADALTDLQSSGLDFVVSAGDAVRRGSARNYREVHAALDGMPVVPLPGAGEQRGDRDLSRFYRAWPGLGVRGVEREVSWRAFDLVTGGAPWRMLVLDAAEERLGDALLDELIWVPKVVAPLTAPLLVVSNAPVATLVSGAVPSNGARRLHEQVRRHTESTRVPLVAAAGGAPELLLPGGRWGEAWLGVGRISGPPASLRQFSDQWVIDDRFDAALIAYFGETTDVASLVAGGPFAADRYPLAGWWRVTAGPADLVLELRMRGPSGWQNVFTIRWSRASGWE